MARCVFFSFHYDRDIWRVSQIRNSGVVPLAGVTSAGFIDSAAWESIKRQGDDAIRKWIDRELEGTSVTVVLIGTETANRQWVNYEIVQSVKRNNGLLGVYIDNVKDVHGQMCARGANPFDSVTWKHSGRALSETYPTYDWVTDDGRRNLAGWIEAAAKRADR